MRDRIGWGGAVLGAWLLAGPAWAQDGCPTAADLVRGITVTFDDGVTETFRSTSRPGVVSVRGTYASGQGYQLELAQGIHVLWSVTDRPEGGPDESMRIRYDYGRPPEAMPVPTPGGRFDVASTSTYWGGTQAEAQSQAYGALETLDIGGCAYEAVPVAIAYDSDIAYWEELTYLPALGFAVLRSQSEQGAEPTPVTPVSIRAGK